jgi:hypothetical protein
MYRSCNQYHTNSPTHLFGKFCAIGVMFERITCNFGHATNILQCSTMGTKVSKKRNKKWIRENEMKVHEKDH